MKEYLFEYHFGGSTWGMSIHADSQAEAREKIKAAGMARYKGEIGATIRMPDLDWLNRFVGWLFGMKPR